MPSTRCDDSRSPTSSPACRTAARGKRPSGVSSPARCVTATRSVSRFNDEHGHQAGDRVLAESARAWQSQLRGSDVLARYGGEEFAALIPAWPLDAAVEVVERLRQATAGGLTASAGVASWDGTETGEELFGRADAALYEAKQSGRDRTVAAR
jgi:diguanylate cyclase (GGDEF)-like protein